MKLDPKRNRWLTDAKTRAVLAALGPAARFVGGAVRNALLGLEVSDIDIATPLTPDEVTRRLQSAGLGAVPTGIEHGTVTAISTGAGLWLLLRADASWAKAIGLALAIAPHLVGAPHEAAFVSKAPAELAARFAAASLFVQAALWIVSGLMAGQVWVWFSRRERT